MIRVHGTKLSGHTHRVTLLLSALAIPFEFVPAPPEVRRAETFKRLNGLQQIPVFEDGELVLSDSNAILVYLCKRYAPGSEWLPEDPVAASHVQRWLSIAAGEVMYGPASARMITQWQFAGDLARAQAISGILLDFMDDHLKDRTFLAANHITIADLACYSYVAHAREGGVALDHGNVARWLKRVEATPGFEPMPLSPLPPLPAVG